MPADRLKEVEKALEDVERLDYARRGRFFAYVHESGDEELERVALEALVRFYNKNALDFTWFRSAMFLERELVAFGRRLLHGGDEVVGTFTFGGTESVLLAVLAARGWFRRARGRDRVPELVAPFTIHPSFIKGAWLFGLRLRLVDIDHRLKADVEAVKEAVGPDTALVALSAPNWPYGTIDPVRDVAEYARDMGVPVHVDACVGGFVLPFFERLGVEVPPFDFRVEGVTSISADYHKYGYTPLGASLVLFRSAELKGGTVFVNTANPGYIFVNEVLLSSRSVGPMAAAYAVVRYLGEEGYLRLAGELLRARDAIYGGLRRLGFESVGPVESPILSLKNEGLDLAAFTAAMKSMGWMFGLQRGVKRYGVPPNIHLAVFPIHARTAGDFLRDAEAAVEMVRRGEVERRVPAYAAVKELVERLRAGAVDPEALARVERELEAGNVDSSLAVPLVELFEPEIADEFVRSIVLQSLR